MMTFKLQNPDRLTAVLITRFFHLAVAATCGLGLAAPSHAQNTAPNEWLSRMADAVKTTDYQGTVVRVRDGNAEALKVVHAVRDGVVHEKVVVQEGNGLEIIRSGNEVQCILPDRRSVLVEQWNDQSALFSTLPSSQIRFGNEYDVAVVRTGRIAGRKAVLLAIRPHDEFRFGHRLWLDTETAFPLQSTLLDSGGETIVEVKFADIVLGQEIHASLLAPSTSIENFRWFTNPKRVVTAEASSDWSCANLPAGFRAVATHQEDLDGSDEPLTHIMYSDGLASVSVFIKSAAQASSDKHTRRGAANSYSLQVGEWRVTAVGEVPAVTVEQIASSMQRNK